jgi:hypothetical protein
MQKISLLDLSRIALNESEEKCNPSLGDLVKIRTSSDPRGSIIGIVTKIEPRIMCLLVNNKATEWWSRFVKCDILS